MKMGRTASPLWNRASCDHSRSNSGVRRPLFNAPLAYACGQASRLDLPDKANFRGRLLFGCWQPRDSQFDHPRAMRWICVSTRSLSARRFLTPGHMNAGPPFGDRESVSARVGLDRPRRRHAITQAGRGRLHRRLRRGSAALCRPRMLALPDSEQPNRERSG